MRPQAQWVRSRAGESPGEEFEDDSIAFWTMDNLSGTTLVDEKGAYDGTITGADPVVGVIGNGLSFSDNPSGEDSANAYVTHSDITFTGDFFASFFLDVDTGLKQRGIWFGKRIPDVTNTFFGYYNDSQIIRVLVNENSFNSGTITLPSGFRNIIFGRVATDFVLYVDSVLVSTWSGTGLSITVNMFGSYTSGLSSVHSRWTYDQWRYFDRAPTQEDADALFAEV